MEVEADSPKEETDLERRIAHAVAAVVVPEMAEGWMRKDMEESLRRMPSATEDWSSLFEWETGRDAAFRNIVAMVLDGNWKAMEMEMEIEIERVYITGWCFY